MPAQWSVIETVIRGLWTNQYPVYNVQRWVVKTAGVTDANVLTDFKWFLDQLMGAQDDIQCNLIYYLSHIVNEVYPNPRYIGAIANNKTRGSIPEQPLPIGVVFHGCQVTADTRLRGHKYFAGPALSQVTNGVLTSTALTTLNGIMSYYSGGWTRNSHSYQGVVWSAKYLKWEYVTAWTYDNLVTYCRRRRPRE
jgi:hypothetical protein